MPLRDLLVTAIVIGSLPVILYRPVIGVLVWSWIGYMNPHRLTWGFAYDLPLAQVIALATLAGIAFTAGRNRAIPRDGLVYILIAFNLWMVVTTLFAIYPDEAWIKLEKVLKIQVMTFITLMLVKEWRYLHALVWVIVISLGFYGVKGGIFTLLSGGQYSVLGPPGTFFEGNTTVALALLMTLPLMRYLRLESRNRWVRLGLLASMGLTAIAILGTYSRGALLGAIAMGMYWVWKTPHRGRFVVGGLFVAMVAIPLFPQQWYERMETVQNYEEDQSAMGRIHAWRFTLALVAAKPITGGGFEPYTRETYDLFAPEVSRQAPRPQGPHSIYFKPLGEHGWPGLLLFLGTGLFAFRRCARIIRETRDREELRWAGNLAATIQVSLVGFAASGAFLGMTYFDLYYHLLALLVVIPVIIQAQPAGEATPAEPGGERGAERRAQVPAARPGRPA